MKPAASPLKSLRGWRVLVTRPEDQANGLCALIDRCGGHSVRFPLIVIEPSATASMALELLQRADYWDWIIFVSPNAVRYACELGVGWQPIPSRARIAAIGWGTADGLLQRGIRVDLRPKAQFNSESLLNSPELQRVEGQRCLIVRGRGGRELIAETLGERGSEIHYAEVYQRVAPATDASTLIAEWRRGEIHAVALTSQAALENLVKILGPNHSDLLKVTPIAVIGERIAVKALELGCERVEIAPEASDEGLCSALMHLANSN